MAISLLKTNKPLSLIPLLALFMLLNRPVNSANFVNFKYDTFSPDENDLTLQGDAEITNNVLQLTGLDSQGVPLNNSVGRALYYAPVRLWESSQVEAKFETTFTFQISAPNQTSPADGLAFFIARADTQLPPHSTGSLLGLFPNSDFNDEVVAVEFDTYPNADIGDPDYVHIGIDVNSIWSNITEKWDWKNGQVATARINYVSAAKILSVVVTYHGGSSVTLDYEIVINTFLPQWVRVGFSASTGVYKQANTILSWEFKSELEETFAYNLKKKKKKKDMYNNIASVV